MDFNRLQALNLVFHSSINSSPPATPVEGQPWYVTDLDVLKVYTGSVWNPLVVGPSSSTSGRVPSWNGTSGGALNDGYDVVTTIGDPGADTALPTEQAVREAINTAIASEVSFKGGYNAATNTPDLDVTPSGVKAGDMYFVTVTGTFFTTPLEAGDVIIANIDSADAENEWTMIQKNLPSLIPVANGGTGLGTLTQYGIMIGAGTGNVQFVAADATANKHLKNVSASANPVWSTSSFAEAASAGQFLRASGANVWAASTLTLPNAAAQYTILYASATDAIGVIAAAGTTGTFLRGVSAGAPAWSTLALPNAATQYAVWYASATNTMAEITAPVTTGRYFRGVNAGAPVWSTLILPNAGTVGDLPHVSAADTITMLTSVATAGSFLRGGGAATVPAWSTVKLPDTMSALGIWVANSVNTVVNLTVTALQSIRLNSGGTAWEAYTPTGGGNHNILDGTTHPDSVAQTVTRGSLIYGNATPKWDELAIQASGASGYVLATDANDLAWKKQRFVQLLTTSATSYDIVHNLGTRRVIVICQDTTNNQNIMVDWQCKSAAENTTITVYFGTAPTANTRIVTVFGINFGASLDTSNS